MFPSKSYITNHHLLAIALTAMLAACSSNPSGSNGSGQNPIDRGSTTQSVSSADVSRAANSSNVQTTAPVAQLVSTPVPLASGHPDEYTVQVGDTLWDIAATFLRDPWYWPEVWYVNPQIENPHLIYPGDVLALVVIEGQQRITNVRASTYRLSPAVRVSPLNESIVSVPYESVAAFLSQGLILEASQIKDLAYIMSIRGDHMIAAAGNEIYIRGGQPAATGTRYSLVHIGDELVDPDDGRTVGYQGIYIGEGAMIRGGDPATVALSETNREAVLGDRLISEDVNIPLNFFPKAPDSQIDGRIISVVDGVSLIARFRVVVVNRGANDGLNPGDVLAVFQAGEVVKDPFGAGTFVSKGNLTGGKNVKLPDEEAGSVMVFKVYNRISYALVMRANSEIRVLDAVRSPN